MKYLIVLSVLFFASSDKGYKQSFANYYTEAMDSVVVGNNKIVFQNVQPLETTGFYNINKGTYGVTFITKSKKKFYSSITVPKTGTGNKTLEIDATVQIQVLEE